MVAQQAPILWWGGASFSVTKAKSSTMMKQFYLPLPCLDPASADMHPFLPFLNPFARSFVTAIQFFNARQLFLDGLSCLYMKTPSPLIVLEVSIYHSCLCPSIHYSFTLVQPPFVGLLDGWTAISAFLYLAYIGFFAYIAWTVRQMYAVHSRLGVMFTALVEIVVSTITLLNVCTPVGFKITMVVSQDQFILSFVSSLYIKGSSSNCNCICWCREYVHSSR